MEQLTIKNKTTEEVVKAINKFRLENKNKWYQVEVTFSRKKYKLKVYNTWVQIGRKYFTDTNELIHDYPSPMDMNITEFKKYLSNFLINN